MALQDNAPRNAGDFRSRRGKGVRSRKGGTIGRAYLAAATSTRLSKKVAPPPRSVSAVLVVALQLTRSGVYLFHQIPCVTTTPALTVSPTTARAWKLPRSLKTRTRSPLARPRARASVG